MSQYKGGKNGAGVYQTLINQIPPHDVYIEAFVGSGAVLRHKRTARSTIAIDADAAVCRDIASLEIAGLQVVCASALDFLAEREWSGREVVYCDPPYLGSERRCSAPIYPHEFSTDAEHLALLTLLRSIPAPVMLSGYPSALYADLLHDWRSVTYTSPLHRGRTVRECLWMNYAQPLELHDYRYLGDDYRERELLSRKKKRLLAKLAAMPAMERYATLSAVEEFKSTASPELTMQYWPLVSCSIDRNSEGTR